MWGSSPYINLNGHKVIICKEPISKTTLRLQGNQAKDLGIDRLMRDFEYT